MNTYLSKELGFTATVEEAGVILHREGISILTNMNEADLITLKFKEIIENPEKQEDVVELIVRDYRVFCYDMGNEEALIKAVKKNLPKTKKVEENDIRDHVLQKNLSHSETAAIFGFLQAFNLLA